MSGVIYISIFITANIIYSTCMIHVLLNSRHFYPLIFHKFVTSRNIIKIINYKTKKCIFHYGIRQQTRTINGTPCTHTRWHGYLIRWFLTKVCAVDAPIKMHLFLIIFLLQFFRFGKLPWSYLKIPNYLVHFTRTQRLVTNHLVSEPCMVGKTEAVQYNQLILHT